MISERKVLKSTIFGLEKVLNELKTCKIKKIESYIIKSDSIFNEAEESEILEDFKHISGRYIYIIKYLGVLDTFNEIKETYEAFNKNNKPREAGITFNTSRYNEFHKSEYLYVGTSKKLKSRIKQHLGLLSSKRTYSMHLIHWFPKYIDLEINIIEISSNNKMVFESIEQTYWDIFKPLFGKRSGL